MSGLTAAVIGTGFIGPIHVEGLRRLGVRVAGILGSTPQKSRAAAETLNLPIGYSSLDDLINDEDVDVVHITSPNRYHHQQARRTISAGKHVLCEKPLAMNADQSRELVRAASEADVATGVNYNIRYYPLCIEAAERFRSGQVGSLFHVAGSYTQDWLFHPADFNWRVVPEDGGELRAVADIGTHWLDLVQYITGQKVQAVCADLSVVHPKRERPIGGALTYSHAKESSTEKELVDVATEDCGNVLLRFAGGSKGVLWVSQVTAGRKNCLKIEISGSRQALSWCSESPNELWIGHRDVANESLIRDPSLMNRRAADMSSYPGGHNEGFGDTSKQLFKDFYAAIESGTFQSHPTYPTFDDGHHEILLCEAIMKSHQTERWVDVEHSDTHGR